MLEGAKLPIIETVNGTTNRALPCATALNRCQSERMPFDWTLNPYRGCEMACRYCYARYTHEYLGLTDPRSFETEVFSKVGAPEALKRDLARTRDLDGGIAIGTATDPYQPAERRMLITRKILEVLARTERARPLRLSITTKSSLVTRDLDLLTEINRRHRLTVNMTITTLSRRLARQLEPRAPRPALRLLAARELAAAGIEVGVLIMPVVPGLTDRPESLEAIVAAAARAGASHVGAQVLFLRSSSRAVYYRFLRVHHPGLLAGTRRLYDRFPDGDPEYRSRISGLVRELRGRYGLASRPARESGPDSDPAAGPGTDDPQLQLDLGQIPSTASAA